MKKVFLLLIGLSLSVCSIAQEGNSNVTNRMPKNHNLEGGAGDNNSGFGIKGGVNFNTLRGNDKDILKNFENQTTWHAGIYGQFPVGGSDFFSIQTEALFNRRGFKSDSLDVTMDNIEVPLLFTFNFLDNVSFHIGPYGGVLLTVKEHDVEVGEASKKLMNSFVYGAAAGVEARLGIARIGGRYTMGLNEIYKDPKTVDRLNKVVVEDIKNGAFQVYVGVGVH